jgi:GNAT superfamily N-acetyltransferase
MHPSDRPAPTHFMRPCERTDTAAIARIVNTAAEAYRGVIPPDRWHEPYMPQAELQAEIDAGVRFIGYVADGDLVGVMGLQPVRNVRLIRHAYVLPAWQGHGVGSKLLRELCRDEATPVLIGTWRAATWAIAFYHRHDFETVPEAAIAPLLRTYWDIPPRQIETSVVLAAPALSLAQAQALIAAA